MQEALLNVRQALGTDALIESTRHIKAGQDERFGRGFVEIIAAPSQRRPGARSGVSLGAEVRMGRVASAAERRPMRTASTGERKVVVRQTAAADRSAARAPAVRSAPSQRPLDETDVGRELMHLRLLIDELSQGRTAKDRTRARLAAAGFDGAVARTLCAGASRPSEASDDEVIAWLRGRVRERLTCRSGLLEAPGRRLIACVGPTGVGKTTTLAKLAARAVLKLGRSVRVISLDTFRVGAVEQWRRYAELIGFPFDVATNAGTFHRVAHNHSEDILLIDTTGSAVGEQQATLAGCVAGLRDISHEVLLVLPAWMRARDSERMVSTFAAPRVTGVVVTKLDETDQVGGVMQASIGSDLPLAYLCNGARVPEDIHDAAVDNVLDAIFPEQP